MTDVSFPAAAVNCGDGSLAFLKPFPSADTKGLRKSYVWRFYRKGIPKIIRRLSEGGHIMLVPFDNRVVTTTASEAALLVDRTNGCLPVILV